MARNKAHKALGWVIAFALAAFAFWLKHESPLLQQAPPARTRASHKASGQWQELKNCRLVADRNNDGDSFVIAHSGGEHTVRLYFVDCCEKRRHEFNRARLADQGAYFRGLDENRVLELGRQAYDEARFLLERQPFAVFTRWEPVYDERRHYVHVNVTMPDGTRRWLCEWLVERGLARIYTRGAPFPDGTPQPTILVRLHRLEKTARLAGRGGWQTLAALESPE